MFKKALLLMSVALPFSFSQSFASWETLEESETDGRHTVKAVWKNAETQQKYILESADPTSYEAYTATLSSLLLKTGYPAVESAEGRFQAQNIARQKANNYYHLYTLSQQSEEDVEETTSLLGFVQFGRMPTLRYDEGVPGNLHAHHPIIQKWMSLGITKQKAEGDGLKDDNLERIQEGDFKRGIAMILPLFNPEVAQEQKEESIKACYELVCEWTKGKNLLPVEATLPYAAISLLHPDDSNIGAFAANGFEVDRNEGFGWFYPKEEVPQPRTMITRFVEIRE